MRNRTSPQPSGAPRYGLELALVAGVSLGASAFWALVELADIVSRGPIAEAQARLNTSASPRPWFDLVHQLGSIAFALVPVFLALYLMSRDPGETAWPRRRIGFDLRAPRTDLVWGLGLFLVIGAGTLGVYAAGRMLGLTAEILPANLGDYWWTVPVLVLAAVKNGVLEEVLLLGYGFDRLGRFGVRPWVAVVALALFRGTYHAYQGIGPFLGNVAMGLILGFAYLRTRRVMPLVLTHSLIDTVGFLGPGILDLVDPR